MAGQLFLALDRRSEMSVAGYSLKSSFDRGDQLSTTIGKIEQQFLMLNP